jgi:RimJ/RimL family protein N-acetyltransferase
MHFGHKIFKKSSYIAKIKADNIASIKLFEKMGFKLTKEVACFNEVHYEFKYAEKQINYEMVQIECKE